MLKELRLTNIVLIESASISFGLGFNVLSGESGSGKSAIMNALNLIAGDRSDVSVLRHGSAKGVVEAIFDATTIPLLGELLVNSGIDHHPEDELFIRREIAANGKSRAFINNQLTQISLLRQVAELLFDIVGQHANQKLLSLDYHRESVDLFSHLHPQMEAFHLSWKEETETAEKLKNLIQSEAKRLREIEVCLVEIEEIENAKIQEGEEEEVFAEYSRLSNAEEISEKLAEITRLLDGEKSAFLTQLKKQKTNFEYIARLAPALKETAVSYDNAVIELHEIVHTLNSFGSHIEYRPELLEHLNERLTLIAKLKKKYGPTVSEIYAYLTKTKEKLYHLENADVEIEELQNTLKKYSQRTDDLAKKLTELRQESAKRLKTELQAHLRALNMPKVEFDIEISPKKRSRDGDDLVEFFMIPNVGEHRISISACASGGELSRIMLSLQAVLAGKLKTATIVFDEIDANIGGETAAVVGEKMRQIGLGHQVLCITHFPQVARQAEHHLRISKQEIDGRTLTIVDSLNAITREAELIRMHGGS